MDWGHGRRCDLRGDAMIEGDGRAENGCLLSRSSINVSYRCNSSMKEAEQKGDIREPRKMTGSLNVERWIFRFMKLRSCSVIPRTSASPQKTLSPNRMKSLGMHVSCHLNLDSFRYDITLREEVGMRRVLLLEDTLSTVGNQMTERKWHYRVESGRLD